MKKEKKIIAKIQELVPEIMKVNYELISLEERIITLEQDFRKIEDDTTQAVYNIALQNLKDRVNFLKKNGRDITLEDVLLVLDEKYHAINNNINAGTVLNDCIIDLIGMWKLNKPFQEQNQKTKEFIADLILI